jgi:hypothetical protein
MAAARRTDTATVARFYDNQHRGSDAKYGILHLNYVAPKAGIVIGVVVQCAVRIVDFCGNGECDVVLTGG